jgi:serine/threonine-protein kinase
MAPEQLQLDSTLDHRTDIYSLGVLLHQMLTGSTPYSTKNTQDEIIEKIQSKPLERLVNVYPHVDNRLQKIIDTATSKSPNKRYQNCEAFINDLKELENEAI